MVSSSVVVIVDAVRLMANPTVDKLGDRLSSCMQAFVQKAVQLCSL
jgi:hypothetical protein